MVKWMLALLALAAASAAAVSLGASTSVGLAAKPAAAVVAGAKTTDTPAGVAAPAAAATAPAGDKPAPGGAKREETPAREAPPINITALRDEIGRSSLHETQAGADRGKLERLAADINKARESLREETARLEALLAKRDPSPASSAAGTAGAGGELPEGGKKLPTSLDGLAKAMRGMKPELAAPIISRLERKTAADVLQRMPAFDAGKVLGQCKPEVAAELATEIASRTPRSELKR